MVSRTGDVLKALRSQWLTIPELASEIESQPKTVRYLLQTDLIPHGIIVSRVGKRRRRSGIAPMEYHVSTHWGGE